MNLSRVRKRQTDAETSAKAGSGEQPAETQVPGGLVVTNCKPRVIPPCDGVPPHICGNDDKVIERIQNLLDRSPCGLVVCDALEADCPIIYVNRIFEHITGYRSREILGHNCRFLQYRGPHAKDKHEYVDKTVTRKMQEAISQGQEFRGEILNFDKKGHPLMTCLHLFPLFSDLSQPSLVTHYAGIQNIRPIHSLDLPALTHSSAAHSLHLESVMTHKLNEELIDSMALDPEPGFSLQDLSQHVVERILSFLDMQSLLRLGATCKQLQGFVHTSSVWQCLCERAWGPRLTRSVQPFTHHLGWERVVQELYTLNAVTWRSFTVGGTVSPARTNFSICSVGYKLVLFGGEGAQAVALNDTFVLDLDDPQPAWLPLGQAHPRPPGRWGHTLRRLGDTSVILFGGCGVAGPLNDVFIIDINVPCPVWQQVIPCARGPKPSPRSWHGACMMNNCMLVFSGCDVAGRLLCDTWQLDLSVTPPVWQEIQGGWNPPGRLGLSIVPIEEDTAVMFGGLASAGPVRLRSNDCFTLTNLSACPTDDHPPTWQYISGSTLPAGAETHGLPPSPRLEQVMGQLGGGRVIVFGGSISNNDGIHASQPFMCDVNADRPTWKALRVQGEGPPQAWGYSVGIIDDLRFIMPGRYEGGSLAFNELYELSILTPKEPRSPAGSQLLPSSSSSSFNSVTSPYIPSMGEGLQHRRAMGAMRSESQGSLSACGDGSVTSALSFAPPMPAHSVAGGGFPFSSPFHESLPMFPAPPRPFELAGPLFPQSAAAFQHSVALLAGQGALHAAGQPPPARTELDLAVADLQGAALRFDYGTGSVAEGEAALPSEPLQMDS